MLCCQTAQLLNHWIRVLRERHAHFPRCHLTAFCQCTSFKSNFGLIRHCTAHTPASCKTLANSFSSSDFYASAENEQCAGRLGPRHTLSISGQGLSDHHYRLHSVRPCVELQPFAILRGNQGCWHQLYLRTGQSKYTVSTFFQPLIIFSLEGQDRTRGGAERRRCTNGCCYDHAAVISGHQTQG